MLCRCVNDGGLKLTDLAACDAAESACLLFLEHFSDILPKVVLNDNFFQKELGTESSRIPQRILATSSRVLELMMQKTARKHHHPLR